MAATEFSAFAQKMAVVFRGNDSPEVFTQAMFDAIYLQDNDTNPVEELLPRSYKSYFYGERNITDLAQSIAGSLDPGHFAEMFSSDVDATVAYLCEAFADTCPNINSENYALQIGDRFRRIITDAAATQKRKRRSAKQTTGHVVLPKDKHGVFLVAEVGSVCPNDGCSKSLYIRTNGRLEMIYDVVVIDPAESNDDTDNLLALCPACCAKYVAERTPESIIRLKEIKSELVTAYDARGITSEQTVQDAVRQVISKIPKLHKSSDVDLNYIPVPVRKKIEISNELLYAKAQSHVNLFYPAVNDAFMELSAEGKLRFKPFCLQVRANYLGLQEQGFDQDTIYYQMTKWLFEATNENWNACEIVISYFIQKCEVFDAITE